jgi:uroporphyrinogen decarboxylase
MPADGDLEGFSYRLVDDPAGVHDESRRNIAAALKRAERIKVAGADVVWMGADYAMNTGPFMSPGMFAEFVTPYLEEVIAGFRSLGLYVIKHSDGDLNPIIDQIVGANPHAIHSLDAVANMDIRSVKEAYGDRVALIGNVSHGHLQMRRYERIRTDAEYALAHGGVAAGGYIFSTSNAVLGGEITGIDVEAYRFMLSVRDEFTRALAGDGAPQANRHDP